MTTTLYTAHRVRQPARSATFGTFGWEVRRPDGTVLLTTNSKAAALADVAKLNQDGHL